MDKTLVAGEPPSPVPPQHLSILCVDDEENIIKSLHRIFRRESFQVLAASSGREGLEILKNTENIGLILSDQRMPEMTGAAFLQAAAEMRPDIPRIILTGYADVTAAIDAINQGGAYRFLTKPWNELELLQAVRDGLHRFRLTQENQSLTSVVRRQNEELAEWNVNLKNRVLQQTAQLRRKIEAERVQVSPGGNITERVGAAFTTLLELRSPRFARHFRTVAALAEQISRHLELDEQRCVEIRRAALLHDVGKIGMPDRLLNRGREQMSPDDTREYQSHSVWGQTALEKFEEFREIGLFIRHHHEAYNGSGFPDGLAGDRIPLGARIIGLADWIEITFSREFRPDARYHLTKMLTRDMRHLFDQTLFAAATDAIMKVLRDPPIIKDMSEEKVLVAKLGIGMVLSRDVFSRTGILLLERGTRLEEAEIETLRRYLGIDQSEMAVQVLQRSMGAAR